MTWYRSLDGRTIHAYGCPTDHESQERELILWAQGKPLVAIAEHIVGGGIGQQVRPCPSCLSGSGSFFHDTLLEHVHQILLTVDARTCRDEYDLQTAICAALAEAGIRFEREHAFAGAGRPDVWLPTYRLVLEVKTHGTPAAIRRQLEKYSTVPEVEAIALVTTQNRHRTAVTRTIGGKPARIITLTGAAL